MAEQSQLRPAALMVLQILQRNGVQNGSNEVVANQISDLFEELERRERQIYAQQVVQQAAERAAEKRDLLDRIEAEKRDLIDRIEAAYMQVGSVKMELTAVINSRNYSLAKMAARGALESLADVIRTVHKASRIRPSKIPASRGSKPSRTATQPQPSTSHNEELPVCVSINSLHTNSSALEHLYHCTILPPDISTLMEKLKISYPSARPEFGKTLYSKLSDAIHAYTDIGCDTLVIPHDLQEVEIALLMSLGKLASKSNLLILEPDGIPVTQRKISRSVSLQTLAQTYHIEG
ncbi:hypothetical protein C0992_007276 [Termitomyces sp. T32_za158]|nr:hypothetical protein C0992_007276 [Termitomyces sp. T32_za158]